MVVVVCGGRGLDSRLEAPHECHTTRGHDGHVGR